MIHGQVQRGVTAISALLPRRSQRSRRLHLVPSMGWTRQVPCRIRVSIADEGGSIDVKLRFP